VLSALPDLAVVSLCVCRVACHKGHLVAIRQLLCHLNAVRCHDCCVLALSYTTKSSNTAAMQAVLESPYLPQQLIRCGTAGAGFVWVRLVVQVHVLACREIF
jgi:hypothetical protein